MRTHKLRICLEGHPQIARLLLFRDALRADPHLREEYEGLKRRLQAANKTGMGEYLAQKAPFIDAIVGPPPDA